MTLLYHIVAVVVGSLWGLFVLSVAIRLVKFSAVELYKELYEYTLKRRMEFIEELEKKFDGDEQEVKKRASLFRVH